VSAPSGPLSFEQLNRGDGNQKNWFEQAAGRGSSWVSTFQDLNDASSPPEIAVATVQGRAELLMTLASPGQALLDNGLGFLVSIVLSPLIELAEWAIGDPEQMRATGEGWEQVAAWLDHVAEAEQRRAEATGGVWQGEAGDAFRTQMGEFSTGVTALAQDIRELKGTLDLIADLFDMFVEFVIQIITELIIGLIVEWLAALAASWITAGASVGAASAATTAQVGVTGGRISARIAKLQQQLYKLMERLEKLLQKVRRGPLQKVIERMQDLRGGNIFKQALGRKIDGQNPLIGPLTKADPRTLASTTSNRFLKSTDGLTSDQVAVRALSANISQVVLSRMLGGSSTFGGAALKAGADVGTDYAIKMGAEAVYGEAEDRVRGRNMSEQERRAAQERGFSL